MTKMKGDQLATVIGGSGFISSHAEGQLSEVGFCVDMISEACVVKI